MENASKALLMAAGVLIGVLILALLATLFVSGNKLFDTYENRKKTESIQQFNVNFTKYVGQELTIHQVVTICNFAIKNNIDIQTGSKRATDIMDIVKVYEKDNPSSIQKYELEITDWTDEGYVKKIKITES